MATNPYFQDGKNVGRKSDQDLVESIVIEQIKMAGQDIRYIPRDVVNQDFILNEDPNLKYSKFHTIEMYVENATDYQGNDDMLSKFGLEIDAKADFIVSKRRFTEETGMPYPKEGDLLYWELPNVLFKINHVEHENAPFYQLKKNYVYKFSASICTYSYEDFDTGLTKLDTALDPATFTDPAANNGNIHTEAVEDILEFSEKNPFGTLEPEG